MSDAWVGMLITLALIAVGVTIYQVGKDQAAKEITVSCLRDLNFYYGADKYICSPYDVRLRK